MPGFPGVAGRGGRDGSGSNLSSRFFTCILLLRNQDNPCLRLPQCYIGNPRLETSQILKPPDSLTSSRVPVAAA